MSLTDPRGGPGDHCARLRSPTCEPRASRAHLVAADGAPTFVRVLPKPFHRRQTDGQAELAEGEAPRRWLLPVSVPSKHMMHLVDQPEREIRVGPLARQPREPEKVTDREGVRPQVPLFGPVGGEPRPPREAPHE